MYFCRANVIEPLSIDVYRYNSMVLTLEKVCQVAKPSRDCPKQWNAVRFGYRTSLPITEKEAGDVSVAAGTSEAAALWLSAFALTAEESRVMSHPSIAGECINTRDSVFNLAKGQASVYWGGCDSSLPCSSWRFFSSGVCGFGC
jgi:hypothetical protein